MVNRDRNNADPAVWRRPILNLDPIASGRHANVTAGVDAAMLINVVPLRVASPSPVWLPSPTFLRTQTLRLDRREYVGLERRVGPLSDRFCHSAWQNGRALASNSGQLAGHSIMI